MPGRYHQKSVDPFSYCRNARRLSSMALPRIVQKQKRPRFHT
jgi:hypothetical protein